MATIEEEIFSNLETTFSNSLTWVKHIESKTPFVDVSDIDNTQIPLVQFFWDGQSTQQQNRGFTTTTAPFLVEIVAKDTKLLDMTQQLLFQYRKDVIDAVSSIISLPSVSGFIQFSYLSRNYDIHSFKDFFIAQIRFAALFNEPFGKC